MLNNHQTAGELESVDREVNIVGFPKDTVLRAIEHNLLEMWSNFGRGPGCTLCDEGDALWIDTPIPTLPYNAVLQFMVTSDIDRRIDLILDHYQRRQVAYMWMVHPSSMPSDLGERLIERGLKEVEVVSGMAANLDDLIDPLAAPERFEIHEVDNETAKNYLLEFVAWRWHVPTEAKPHLYAFNQVFHIGTPSAKIHCWLAWHEGAPVSKVVLYCAAGAAGIHGVSTKPEARDKGLASILTLEALQAARKAGYKLSVLHSTPMAQSLYEKLGFHHVAPYRIFASEVIHL
jgi:GNAT superfamily N-acetyltransferase